jgi:two-component system, chemotaxis family, protein-glutamate methylesterase/glutaminase
MTEFESARPHRPAARGPAPWGIVVSAGSAGGLAPLCAFLANLPASFPAPVVVVQHRARNQPELLPKILARITPLHVKLAEHGEALVPGTVYVARPDLHTVVGTDGTLSLVDGTRIKHVLSSANPLFSSAAKCCGSRTIAIVLSGAGSDGTDGVQEVKKFGGTVVVQDRESAVQYGMPGSAIQSGAADYVLPVDEIAPLLVRLVAEEGKHHRGYRRAVM